MSLNAVLMEMYKNETGKDATYNKWGATFHFLGYVDWLENKLYGLIHNTKDSNKIDVSEKKVAR